MKAPRGNLIYIVAIIATIISLVVVVGHRSAGPTIDSILAEAASEYEQVLKKGDLHNLTISEVLNNNELREQMNRLSDRYAERLASLGPFAAETIAREGKKRYYLAHCYVIARCANLTTDEVRAFVANVDSTTILFFENYQEIVLVYTSDTCFVALEKLGNEGARALEGLLTDNVAGAVAAFSLAKMSRREILRNHFEKKNAMEIERLNAATGLAILKDKTVLPFLMESWTLDIWFLEVISVVKK
jgi:hypothetical protein